MESLTNAIADIIEAVLKSDPAVYRIIITDDQGLEISGYSKHWARKPNEKKAKNPVYPLLNSICNNLEKFLGFLRTDKSSPFIFSWSFEGVKIFAASSPYGFMGVFCEPDVNPGLIKVILREKMREYNQLVGPVFRE
ncbi:MAG: hypothetical protein GF364_09895 [Candidatus Lokiarchaeota archaeon]|nr:hypothetical protein [Candidatus Lokiarchaeota archaeon]